MKIHVCKKNDPEKYHCYDPYKGEHYNLTEIETIDRKPFNKGFVGNFVPHWCRYKNKVYLIHGGIDYSYMHDVDVNGMYIVVD